jgi:hypothetical protein
MNLPVGVRQLQPMDAHGQIHRPRDGAGRGLAFRDNFRASGDFPSGREPGRRRELGPHGPSRADHDRAADERSGGLRRQGIEDDFKRGGIRHTAVTLTVQEFGLDSPAFGLSEKVHSARGLQANA